LVFPSLAEERAGDEVIKLVSPFYLYEKGQGMRSKQDFSFKDKIHGMRSDKSPSFFSKLKGQ